MRERVFESLLERNYDEAFALYPLLAEKVFTPADRSFVTFTLNPAAKFSDAKADAVLSINNYNAGVAAVAYYPALTVPMGFQDNGAPQNLTFIAPSRQEQQLFLLAAAYEKLTQHRTPPKEHPHAHEK